MTITQPAAVPQGRYFPSRIALIAAGELVFIAVLLRLSNSPAFFAAAIACSLGAIQLGIVLINRFEANTRQIRKIARKAEFSSQAVLITDPQGRIKWTNPRFTRLTGFYLSEIAGKTFGMIQHGQETKPRSVEAIRQHMRVGEPFDVEVLVYNRTGETLWVSSVGEPIFNTYNQLTHYVITQTCSEISDWRLEDLAGMSPVQTEIQMHESTPTPSDSDSNIASDLVQSLTRRLESLSENDDRRQLQNIVDKIKTKVDQCVEALPKVAADKARNQSANQQNEG
jgi:c-di-GMP-specific phosphodiesterase